VYKTAAAAARSGPIENVERRSEIWERFIFRGCRIEVVGVMRGWGWGCG
jgi:hypothetical protein